MANGKKVIKKDLPPALPSSKDTWQASSSSSSGIDDPTSAAQGKLGKYSKDMQAWKDRNPGKVPYDTPDIQKERAKASSFSTNYDKQSAALSKTLPIGGKKKNGSKSPSGDLLPSLPSQKRGK